MVLRIFGLLVAGYILLITVLYFRQARLIYHPKKSHRGAPNDVGLPYEEVWLQSGPHRIHGWHVRSPGSRALLLFSHGNAGNISHRLESIALFHELGLNVLIYDYRGYGKSGGAPSEKGTYMDLQAAWRHATGPLGYSPSRIYLFGRSLGGGVTSWLATRVKAAGVILESTFTSMPDLAAELYWYIPVRWLISYSYNTADRLHRIKLPILVVHSTEDELIPFSHGQALFQRATEPKWFLPIKGSHNRGFLQSRARYRQGLKKFLNRTGLFQ